MSCSVPKTELNQLERKSLDSFWQNSNSIEIGLRWSHPPASDCQFAYRKGSFARVEPKCAEQNKRAGSEIYLALFKVPKNVKYD